MDTLLSLLYDEFQLIPDEQDMIMFEGDLPIFVLDDDDGHILLVCPCQPQPVHQDELIALLQRNAEQDASFGLTDGMVIAKVKLDKQLSPARMAAQFCDFIRMIRATINGI